MEKTKALIKDSQLIPNILSHLKNDNVLQEFATLYLEKISEKSLNKKNAIDWSEFIETRFSKLRKGISKPNGEFSLERKDAHEDNYYILEMVYPDAQFLILTLESVLNQHNIQIHELFHPIFTIETKVKDISEIKRPIENGNLISFVYAEISSKTGHINTDALRADIQSHMAAVQSAKNDKSAILSAVQSVKTELKNYKKAPAKFHSEWIDLCDWLSNHNFSFFGYCAFTVNKDEKTASIQYEKNSGLGILSKEFSEHHPAILDAIQKHSSNLIRYRSPFIFDMVSYKSPIQVFENLMRLSFKIENEKGKIIEHNFIGLLKQTSLLVPNLETPIIRKKIESIFESKHVLPGSYDFNQIIRIFTATPKFELFRTPSESLLEMVNDLLSITNPNDIYCFTRKHIEHSRQFLLIATPEELFTQENIDIILNYVRKKFNCEELEVIQARNEQTCRLHIYFDEPRAKQSELNLQEIEKDVRELIKPWEERLKQIILDKYPETGYELYQKFVLNFPDHHRVRRTPSETLRDIEYLERMVSEEKVQFNLVPFHFPDSVLSEKASIVFIYNATKIDLITIMPILQSFGMHVYDELTTRIGTKENIIGYIHAFRVAHHNGEKIEEAKYKPIIVDFLEEIFNGRCSTDPLNALALTADLTWRAVDVLKAYRSYYLQLNTRYSRAKINLTLLTYVASTRILFRLFEAKFSVAPHLKDAAHRNQEILPPLKQEFTDSLIHVDDVASDIILKRFFNFIDSTLRTNYYIPKTENNTFISLKIESPKVKLPLPVPYREIFVYDTEMAGCHLRFGPVARGGLRWSDRIDDFRREVLGLVKAQQTKNVVIVPVGSKGGFVLKKTNLSKEEFAIDGIKQYKKLIRGLLDITDNLNAKSQVVPPKNVIRYDGDDPYLVVAADKGTANFSDIANEISENEYKFWLGDGFASGGSFGYNHKAVAITARGGWECVKLHFLEMGKDIQKEPFSVAGIGDMAGDVFGNGMLLSKEILLKAAFNHVHIFLDPNPDADKSFKERQRMFNLPRSSWYDYNAKLISKGGGVYDRKAKQINLSPEAQEMLGLSQAMVTGEELIKSILKMDVDLLWFGGIGTYIKSESETHLQVGDPANDAVRIDHSECKAKVIGEGANLGITMAGRIALNMSGIRLNTDFIDNSAGVNMSDYEVNIKILLQRLIMEGKIASQDERNKILETATEEVSELVLQNNQGQHRLLSMDSIRSTTKGNFFEKLIQHYITIKHLNPSEETLLDHTQFKSLEENSQPIPRPVLSTLQSYTKMLVYNSLVNSSFLMKPEMEHFYINYLPASIRKKFPKDISAHHLKKEIIATVLTNKIINQAGITFFFQTEQLTGRSIEDIAFAYLILDESLQAGSFREALLESDASFTNKYAAWIAFEDGIQNLVIDILQLPNTPLSLQLQEPIQEIFETLKKELYKSDVIGDEIKVWEEKDFSTNVSKTIAVSQHLGTLSDLIYFHIQDSVDTATGLALSLHLDELFGFEWIKRRLLDLPLNSQWGFSQKDALFQTIRLQKTNLVKQLEKLHGKSSLKKISSDNLLESISQKYPTEIAIYFKTLQQLKSSQTIDLINLTVTVNKLNFLLA